MPSGPSATSTAVRADCRYARCSSADIEVSARGTGGSEAHRLGAPLDLGAAVSRSASTGRPGSVSSSLNSQRTISSSA